MVICPLMNILLCEISSLSSLWDHDSLPNYSVNGSSIMEMVHRRPKQSQETLSVVFEECKINSSQIYPLTSTTLQHILTFFFIRNLGSLAVFSSLSLYKLFMLPEKQVELSQWYTGSFFYFFTGDFTGPPLWDISE